MEKKSVLVLDGSSRAALAIVRSLGQKGFIVYAGGATSLARSFFSKYCSGSFVYTETQDSARPALMHEQILAGVKRFKPDVLIPIFSKTVLTVLKNRREYDRETRIIPFAEYDEYKRLDDKAETTKLAEKLGVCVPETFFPASEKDLVRISCQLTYPVLVKPRISAGGFGIRYASCPQELLRAYRAIERLEGKQILFEPFDPLRPIIQRFIEGPVMTVQTYCLSAEAQALFIGRNLRQCPPPYGSPIAYQAVKHPLLEKISRRFLERINWQGPCNLTFIEDARDGIPKLIEVNPRLAGTLESAMAFGVDIPFELVKAALGVKQAGPVDYQEGGVFRWVLFGEFFYWLFSKGKINNLRQLLDFTHCSSEISLKDFKPHLAHLFGLLVRGKGVC